MNNNSPLFIRPGDFATKKSDFFRTNPIKTVYSFFKYNRKGVKKMLEFNKYQLADYLGTTIGTIETNFPKLKARSLKKGILITKRGVGEKAIYEIEKT